MIIFASHVRKNREAGKIESETKVQRPSLGSTILVLLLGTLNTILPVHVIVQKRLRDIRSNNTALDHRVRDWITNGCCGSNKVLIEEKRLVVAGYFVGSHRRNNGARHAG
jgi:uncharacterized membrane protein YhaH (DUF805 family)